MHSVYLETESRYEVTFQSETMKGVARARVHFLYESYNKVILELKSIHTRHASAPCQN